MADCPCGSEVKPGVDTFLFLDRVLIDSIFDWMPAFYKAALYQHIGTSRESASICDSPSPGYPTFDLADLVSSESFLAKANQWLNAFLWDLACQCSECGGDCGDAFTGEEPGLVTLDALNATHHQEGGSEVNPATVQEVGQAYGYSSCIATLNATPEDGDLLLFFVGQADPYQITSDDNLDEVVGAYSTDAAAHLFKKVWHTGDPTHYHFTGHANSYPAVDWFVIRGADELDPIVTSAIQNGNGTHRTLPSVTLTADHQLTIGYSVNWGTEGTWTLASGYGNGVSNHPYDTCHCHQRSGSLDAGATGALDVDSANSAHWRTIQVVVRGALSDVTDWLSWRSESADDYGYAVQDDEGELVSNNLHGYAPDGYEVQYRWPSSDGGTLEGTGAEWKVLDWDGVLLDTHSVPYFSPVEAAVWPCNYSEDPQTEGEFPEEAGDPSGCPEESLAGLAAAVCEIEAKLDRMYGLLSYVGGIASTSQGPFTGSFGPGGETSEGTFQEVVLGALRSIGSSRITGFTSTLLESDCEGDLSIIAAYPGYRVSFTTVPAWAGKRVASVPLYEVNSRQDQLGWIAFKVGSGYLDYRISVWQDMAVWCPPGASEGCIVHLAPGCVADIYGITPVWSSE